MAMLLANQNIPLAFADHLSPLLSDIFPDSKIAKKYASAATKTTCMINGSFAPYFQRELVSVMKSDPYSLLTDGSNDVGLHKMNPVTEYLTSILKRWKAASLTCVWWPRCAMHIFCL